MAYNWDLISVSYHDELGLVCGGQWLRQWWGRPRRIGVQCARATYKIHRNIHHNYRNDGQRSHTCKYNIYREVKSQVWGSLTLAQLRKVPLTNT